MFGSSGRGDVWQQFKPFIDPTAPLSGTSPTDSDNSIDGTQGLRRSSFSRSGVIRLVSDCAQTKMTRINGVEAYWIRGRLTIPIPPAANLRLPLIDRISIRTEIRQTVNSSDSTPETILSGGLRPDLAFADGIKLDTTKSFYPFGQQPQPGTSFYLTCAEALSKPGAKVTLYGQMAATNRDETGTLISPNLTAEYWDGQQWQSLGIDPDQLVNFFLSGESIEFTVPTDLTPTKVNEQEGRWIRIRIVSNTFARQRTVTWPGATPETPNTLNIFETHPPALADFRIGYQYQSPLDPPDACLTYNDFQWQDRSDNARWRGSSFEPFSWVEDRSPTLYLGFDRALPADLISLYLDIEEQETQTQSPQLKWEYWDNTAWRSLSVADETRNLRLPGMVAGLWPGVPAAAPALILQANSNQAQLIDARDAVQFSPGDLLYITENDIGELTTVVDIAQDKLTLKTPLAQKYGRATIGRARLPRFGNPRTWIRTRLQSDGEPLQAKVQGIYLNAVWAAQIQTVENEVLGTSNAQPNQVFFFRNIPVLDGEVIEVRELAGARAQVELPLLMQEIQQQGLTEADVRTVSDRRTGKITEVWVRWQERPNLFFSSGSDRHYLLERSRGRLIFGDGQEGQIPPVGKDNIRAVQYRSGGGLAGNVSQNSITQLLSGVLAQSVHNPRAAEGGADGENLPSVLNRGPQSLRHRYQAIALSDYEALAREASPAVAVARALPTTHPSGRPAPGWVKLIIMPQSQDPQPQPSFELRRQVESYLSQRIPAAVADHVFVTGPDYLPIGVEAVVVPVNPQDAALVLERVRQALVQFLNPLSGGPDGQGWTFGRSVYLSDVAATLERVVGVDYISQLNLLREGTPQPEEVVIPADRIVVAGVLRILLQGGED